MRLTVTTTAPDATDLGDLLRKHPDRRSADTFGYGVKFAGIGPVGPVLVSPTQMAIFDRGAKG